MVTHSITLNVAERQEIDFVGFRCPNVMELLDLLKARANDWESDSDLTLDIDEQTLWAIEELHQADGFGWIRNRSLLNKLSKLCAEVICPC